MFVAAAGLLLTVLAVGGRTQEQKSCPLPPTVGELRDSRSNISFADLLGEWNEAGRVGQEVRDGKFAFVVTPNRRMRGPAGQSRDDGDEHQRRTEGFLR